MTAAKSPMKAVKTSLGNKELVTGLRARILAVLWLCNDLQLQTVNMLVQKFVKLRTTNCCILVIS